MEYLKEGYTGFYDELTLEEDLKKWQQAQQSVGNWYILKLEK